MSEPEFYVMENGKPVGPVALSELRRRLSAASSPNSQLQVCRVGSESWQAAATVPELRDLFQGTPFAPSLIGRASTLATSATGTRTWVKVSIGFLLLWNLFQANSISTLEDKLDSVDRIQAHFAPQLDELNEFARDCDCHWH